MTIRLRKYHVVPFGILVAIVAAVLVGSIAKRSIRAQSSTMEAVARRYSNFTPEQRPTGTVTFLDGATALGTAPLNAQGVATFATTALPAGSDSLTASYAGDGNFNPSVSPAITVTVAATAPSFTLSANPASLSIAPGQSGTAAISVTPVGGFSQPVTFACSGLPSAAACSFAPATVTPGASAATTTLTITTTAPQAALRKNIYMDGVPGILALASLLLFLMPGARRGAYWGRLALLVIALFLGGGLTGCGGGGAGSTSGSSGLTSIPGTPSGTSTVTVTATSGSLSQTATLKVAVQ